MKIILTLSIISFITLLTVESLNGNEVKNERRHYHIYADMHYLTPTSSMSRVIRHGAGGMLSLQYRGINGTGILLGVEAGGLYFDGKYNPADYMDIHPVFLSLGYSQQLITNFNLIVQLSAGASHYNLAYDYYKIKDINTAYNKKTAGTKVVGKIALFGELSIKQFVALRIGVHYGLIFENELHHFISPSLGIGLRF